MHRRATLWKPIGVENRGQNNYTRDSRNLCAKFGYNRQSGFQVRYSARTNNVRVYILVCVFRRTINNNIQF